MKCIKKMKLLTMMKLIHCVVMMEALRKLSYLTSQFGSDEDDNEDKDKDEE